MKIFYLPLVFATLAAATASAQFNATITVINQGAGQPLENAIVTLNGEDRSTDVAGQAIFQGLQDHPYEFSVSATCFDPSSGTVIIAGADGFATLELAPATTNNLFFYIGDPLALLGATVQVTNGGDFNRSFVTTDTFGGEMMDSVPYGEMIYRITAPCYQTLVGTVTVGCNEGDGIAVIANPVPNTTNNLYFFIGDPMAILGATVEVTNGADFNQSFVTTDTFGGEVMGNVPYGNISYTITTPCYETVTGTVTVDCNNANGIAVMANPAPATTNNLFFYIGDPMAILGATVEVTNGADFNQSFVTTDTFGGEMLDSVPYGDISYTITTPCYETVFGSLTVNCNNGDGIAIFTNPAPMTMNNLFFYIGDPMAILGATVEVTDGANYNASFVTTDTFGGEMLADVPFGEISYTITTPCYETVTGTVTVDCNNGDGIAIFTNPAPVVIDATVSLSGSTLTAVANATGYQWVDCDNNNMPIDGATGQSFEPTENGNYAVMIYLGDCMQTSSCTAVILMGVNELAGRDAFSVYPNPFGDRITVSTDGTLGPVHVELLSLTGQVIMDETRSGMEITLQTANLPSGSYILRLSSDNARSTVRVVK